MFGLSLNAGMNRHRHPWRLSQVSSYSISELIGIYNEIEMAFANGLVDMWDPFPVHQTQARINQVLLERTSSRRSTSLGFNPGGLGGVGLLSGVSPGLVIGQTLQQGVINLPVPQPKITISAPEPVVPLPAPELPKRIATVDKFGNIVEVHDETEGEKEDREYEEWKKEFGAK